VKKLQIASRLANIDPAVAEIFRELEEAINAHQSFDTEGFGDPEGAVVGRKGMRYRRIDGGACFADRERCRDQSRHSSGTR
jgi:hypothetical protein